jgi:hypothetical protein
MADSKIEWTSHTTRTWTSNCGRYVIVQHNDEPCYHCTVGSRRDGFDYRDTLADAKAACEARRSLDGREHSEYPEA